MLLEGFNHVAVLTGDTERFVEFYRAMFGAEVIGGQSTPIGELTFVKIGKDAVFGRGRIDHLGLQAASLEAFEEIRGRLMERGAADDFVTDFGPVLSLFFTDPDGLEGEVCVPNPDAVPGVSNPPGTRAARYPAA
jgi:catechol 2,3-dioxygenase-like lactoylglutathione lyase family enzyme